MRQLFKTIRSRSRLQLILAGIVVVLFSAVGSYLLVLSNAQSPSASNQPGDSSAADLLRPVTLGFVPYQYVAYSSSMEQTRQETGVEQYIAAFIIDGGNCTPSWGGTAESGLTSPRADEIGTDIGQIQAAGGAVAVSFGGALGTELASGCSTVPELTRAYRSVVDRYDVDRLDFDIEGPTLLDEAGNARRAESIAALQRDDPGLEIWVTLAVHGDGLTSEGVEVVRQLRDAGVILAGVNIMAMNYNSGGSPNMGRTAVRAAEATYDQLQALYPGASDETVWQAIGITVMVGKNDIPGETLTLANARQVRSFATQRNIGLLSMWNTNRDRPCADGNTELSVSCSSVEQQEYEYLNILRGQSTQ